MSPFRRLLIVILLAVVGLGFSGCATHDPDRDSDMPWNMPQSWEGSPAIPGLSN